MILEDCVNFLLTKAQHRVFNKQKEALAAFDVTPIQYGVINCVHYLNLTNPKDIANYLEVENSTISGILERMEKKGLLIRSIDENDRRYIKVSLTGKAINLVGPINEAVDEVNREVAEYFSEDDFQEFKKYLRRINTI